MKRNTKTDYNRVYNYMTPHDKERMVICQKGMLAADNCCGGFTGEACEIAVRYPHQMRRRFYRDNPEYRDDLDGMSQEQFPWEDDEEYKKYLEETSPENKSTKTKKIKSTKKE